MKLGIYTGSRAAAFSAAVASKAACSQRLEDNSFKNNGENIPTISLCRVDQELQASLHDGFVRWHETLAAS